jgi:hypothetical protein
MASEIRANKSTNRAGLGTVTYADTGIIVSGIVTCTELSGLTALNISGVGTANTLDINGDIDVDGHTNLDNVSIAGVTTFGNNITASGTSRFEIASMENALLDGEIAHTGDTDTLIKFPSNNTISFDTAGSERLRIGSSGQLGIAGANYGSSGQVLTSGGSGSAISWTTITGTTINNNANNRVITGSDSANTLEGEAQLTFALSSNDAILKVTGANSAGHAQLTLQTGGTTDHCSVNFGDSDDDDRGEIRYTNSSDSMNFDTAATHRMTLDANGYLLPATNNTYDLGSSSLRWRDIYTNDLNLSNEGSANSVDGTWGDYTIQEGESDLFLINNRSGKKYKFNLTEVS